MADTLTTNLLLTNQENGGNENTWGDKADANFEQIDDVLGDTLTLSSLNGGTTTLTDEQELVAIIECSGTLLANEEIEFTGRGGFWIVKNATSGDFTLTCLVSGQTGVAIPQGSARLIYCNGTDIFFGNPPQDASAETTIASASTTDILGAETEYVAISGTATITSFGTGTNKTRFVRATGAFTLTHNATSLIVPGGADRTVEAGDTFIVVSDASSNARIYAYQTGDGDPYEPTDGIQTGDILASFGAGARAGFVRLNGRTVGSASSGATERANADVEDLYTHLWDSLSDNVCAVTGGRGASAAADWAANKPMALPDARGRGLFGVDGMGAGSEAGVITDTYVTGGDSDSDTPGGTGGAEDHTLVLSEITAHDHDYNDPGHPHDVPFSTSGVTIAASQPRLTNLPGSGSNGEDAAVANTTGITFNSAGGGEAHDNMPPFMLVTWYIKL